MGYVSGISITKSVQWGETSIKTEVAFLQLLLWLFIGSGSKFSSLCHHPYQPPRWKKEVERNGAYDFFLFQVLYVTLGSDCTVC